MGMVVDIGTNTSDLIQSSARVLHADQPLDKDCKSQSSAAVAVATKGVARLTGSIAKGALVDIPLALTEGLHNMPALYNDKPRDFGPVDSAKAGGIVAAKVRLVLSLTILVIDRLINIFIEFGFWLLRWRCRSFCATVQRCQKRRHMGLYKRYC